MMNTPPTLPGFPPADTTPIDQSHAEERQFFELMLGDLPWSEMYLSLLDEGWYWRDAAYIAWFALPKEIRQPRTIGELAQMLGIGHRGLNNRVARNPAIRVRAAKMVAGRVFDHMDEVMDALVESARNPGYKHHADRKMFLEMAGAYTPKQSLELGAAPEKADMSALSEEELARQARLTAHDDDGNDGA